MNVQKTSQTNRPPSQHRRSSKIILALIFAVILLVAVWGISALAGALTTVKKIEIKGESPYSDDAILAVLGIETGDRRGSIDAETSEKKILGEFTYISDIDIKCSIFGNVKIHITSDKALYATELSNDVFVMSEDFRILDITTAENMPDGIIKADLPKVKTAFKGREMVFYEDIGFLEELIETLNGSFMSGKIDHIYAVDKYDIEISFDGRYTVKFGEFADMQEKLRLSANMLANVPSDTVSKVVFDVSDPSSASIRYLNG